MAPHVPIKTVPHRFIKSSILSPCASVSSSNSTENNSLAAASRHHRFLWTCSDASFPSLSDLEPNYKFADRANHAHCNIRPLLNAQKTHTHTLRLGMRFLWPLFIYGAWFTSSIFLWRSLFALKLHDVVAWQRPSLFIPSETQLLHNLLKFNMQTYTSCFKFDCYSRVSLNGRIVD